MFDSNGLQNVYNAYGYLQQVQSTNKNGNGQIPVYYTVNSVDHRGNITQYSLGAGVTSTQSYNAQTGRLEDQSVRCQRLDIHKPVTSINL